MKRECDCENCILGWEERGYDDCDAGCYYYPDLWTNGIVCHMPYFIKKILLNRRIRQQEKSWEGSWEGYAEFIKEKNRKDDAMREAIKEVLLKDGGMICYKGNDGEIYPFSEYYLYHHAWEVVSKYEELLNRNESED